MPVSGFSSRTYVAIPFDLTAGRSVQNNGTPRGGRMPLQVTAAPVTPPYIGPPRSLTGGYLVAFDPATRTERWRVDGGGGSGGGVLATASNLVFQTVSDGRLRALAAEDGTVLWEVQTGQRGMGHLSPTNWMDSSTFRSWVALAAPVISVRWFTRSWSMVRRDTIHHLAIRPVCSARGARCLLQPTG